MKKYVIGCIFGMFISFSSVGLASSDVVAKYFNPNIIKNGSQIALKNQPVLIDGSTYLPMRELSNILGYDVTYKASSKTIELSNNTNDDIQSDTTKDTQNEGVNNAEWVSYSDLAEIYGLSVEAGFRGVNVSNNEIKLHIPPFDIKNENEKIRLTTNLGEIQIKIYSGQSFLYMPDLKKMDIIK